MLTTKKISPIEFRLHNKIFSVDFSPENYFEKFRFEIIFQRILFRFYIHYGIYFYIQKLKIVDDKILFQFYYYKTYLFTRYLRARVRTKSDEITYWKSSSAFFDLPQFTYHLPQIKLELYQKYQRRNDDKILRLKSVKFINLFFKYFWWHYFCCQATALYKSIFKTIISYQVVKAEYKKLLVQTRYIHRNIWALDFLFFFNHFIVFYNSNFLFPFFVHHIKHTVVQKPIIRLFINILRLIYFYRGHIKGVRLLIHGTVDRHGRTKTLVYDLGIVSVATVGTTIIFETIQCPTKYGIISIKLWVCYYSEFDVQKSNKNKFKNEKLLVLDPVD